MSSTYRAGYDLTELVYIKETGGFGITPTTGAWNPVWRVRNFRPRRVPEHQEPTGVGSQVPVEFLLMKEHSEIDFEIDVVKKQTSPTAYNWKDFLMFWVATGQTSPPSNHIDSFSIGGKLTITTPEYWWGKGHKLRTFEIRGERLNDYVKARVGLLGQVLTFGTTDYVSGSATRVVNPVSAGVRFGDADVLVGPVGTPVSIIGDLETFSLNLSRTINPRGTDSTNHSLYKQLVEENRQYQLEIKQDFDSTTELTRFMASTDLDATVKVPSEAGGVSINLTNGRWLDHQIPVDELKLIGLTLTARFKAMTVADIS